MKCEQCNSEAVIYSGVDAFALGVMDKVGRICYSCAYQKGKVGA